jgi:hypothetical protein
MDEELRETPFAGTPSETYAAGWCPGCGGTGKVNKVVPVEGTYICSSCNGGGTRASFDALMEAMGKEELER